MAIYRGQTVRIDGVFEQPAGDGTAALYDPSPSPTLTVRHPGTGTVINASVVRESEGKYYSDVTLAHVGRWAYRWAVAGAQPAAQEGGFMVEMSSFPV